MKVNVEIEFNEKLLYSMTKEEFVDWYNFLHNIEQAKYDYFIEYIKVQNLYNIELIKSKFGTNYYRAIIEPQLMPFELKDYKNIKYERIMLDKNRKSEFAFIIIDVDTNINKVIIYNEVKTALKKFTIKEMYDLFVRYDGTKFEKEVK